MDNIMRAAKNFEKLFDKEYKISIAHKKNKNDLKLIFEKSDFKHLTGVQYLKDIDITNSSNKFFDKCLKGEINDKYLQNSIDYTYIESRIKNLAYLEKYLDDNLDIFKWDNKKSEYSLIVADYMMKENTKRDEKAYVFFKEYSRLLSNKKKLKVDEIREEHAISFFLNNKDYSMHQVPNVLLKKEKIDLKTGKVKILYDIENQKKIKSEIAYTKKSDELNKGNENNQLSVEDWNKVAESKETIKAKENNIIEKKIKENDYER